ncbi:MAG: zf-HC2 domain-containing protein [Bryobacteraceae bacterium]
MRKCLNDGLLRTWLDGELPENEMALARAHVEVCEQCAEKLARLEASAARVSSRLGCLGPEDLQIASLAQDSAGSIRTVVRRVWPAVGVAAALAAVLFLGLALVRRPAPPVPAPIARAMKREPPATVVRIPVTKSPKTAQKARPARRQRPRPPKPEPLWALDGSDPMQMGMVVRVMVPATELAMSAQAGGPREIAADVVIGEDGRARAIRFVQ